MKILIVCTSHDTYPNKSSKTGLWLSELTHFYDVMMKKKLLVDIASPLGGKIPVDERSFDLKDECNARYWKDDTFCKKLNDSFKFSELDPKDYRLVYITGGHGAMWDLPGNADLQEIIRVIYERNGMVLAVSHGVSALLNVRLSSETFLIKDKYVTGASNMEETLLTLITEVPFSFEDAVKERGGHFTKSMIPFMEFIEMDERLITGQNPNSARKIATKAMEELFEK